MTQSEHPSIFERTLAHLRAIEQLVLHSDFGSRSFTGSEVGMVIPLDDAAARYVHYLEHAVSPAMCLTGLKVVIDCARANDEGSQRGG